MKIAFLFLTTNDNVDSKLMQTACNENLLTSLSLSFVSWFRVVNQVSRNNYKRINSTKRMINYREEGKFLANFVVKNMVHGSEGFKWAI